MAENKEATDKAAAADDADSDDDEDEGRGTKRKRNNDFLARLAAFDFRRSARPCVMSPKLAHLVDSLHDMLSTDPTCKGA